ncbi:MAG: glycine cleavage system aminomethyltransferase GcvT [Gammaproteobacteria bacterium]|nr:glycine cleavage system aminomethyltransferase GcvT [Gammaproteobacteria bacterium]
MSDTNEQIQQTALHDLHVELGAKMVPFAGYSMPVQYPMGLAKEHLHTRAQAGLFDVSHMGQVKLTGEKAAEALETLVPVDIAGLQPMKQRYALFTNDQGGVMDDLMVTNAGDHLFVVVNAACKDQDINHMREHIGNDCEIKVMEDYALLALQGPMAGAVMNRLSAGTDELVFMTAANIEIDGMDCFVTRSGYSGEDGFEISVHNNDAQQLARTLLAQPEVEAIGLGARDSLRLECGLCLYGHDLDTETTPVESSLLWALTKSRRADGARPGGYPGADIIMGQMANGVEKKRVGIQAEGRMPVRDGAVLVDADGNEIGVVTSGGFGPTVNGPIAMGYVKTQFATPDTELFAIVRDKQVSVKVVKLPFVKQNYYRG